MSLRKQYLKRKPLCKVTFSLPTDGLGSPRSAHLVGDFNNWNKTAAPMRRLKNGSFTLTVTLERNREYQFRYLLDGQRWENDREADRYVPNDFGSENSVVAV